MNATSMMEEAEEGSGIDTRLSFDSVPYEAVLEGELRPSSAPANLWHISSGVVAGLLFGLCLSCLVFFVRRYVRRRRAERGTYHPYEVENRTNKGAAKHLPPTIGQPFDDDEFM